MRRQMPDSLTAHKTQKFNTTGTTEEGEGVEDNGNQKQCLAEFISRNRICGFVMLRH